MGYKRLLLGGFGFGPRLSEEMGEHLETWLLLSTVYASVIALEAQISPDD